MAGETKGSAGNGRHARRTPPLFSTRKRLAPWQRATALVPLALLSGAWTTSMTLAGQSADASSPHTSRLPDGTPIPSHPLKKPASIAAAGSVAPAVPSKDAARTVATAASPDGIPAVALAAYQNAARVIDRTDPSCHLPWQLLAAIGRVESDHGRYGGNVLGSDGVARPGIYGIPLDGSNGTADIADTDNGRYDQDPVFDRAVGPMQFIPSTWAVVGVDGDGDGIANPQDINDAALGAAVYLCAGHEDLSTQAGRAAAVYRYNHNSEYVRLVLSIMHAYLDGDYTAAPIQSTAPAVFGPGSGAHTGGKHKATHAVHHHARPAGGGKHRAADTRSGGSSGGSSGGGAGGQTSGGTSGGSSPSPSPAGSPSATVTATAGGVTGTVQGTVIDLQQAEAMCTSELTKQYGAAPQKAVTDCANQIVGMTQSDAQDAVSGVVAGLSGLVGSLLGNVTGSLLPSPSGGSPSPSGGSSGGGGLLGGLGGALPNN